jgi:hypothetical protein
VKAWRALNKAHLADVAAEPMFWSDQQVSVFLGVSVATVRRWRALGQGPAWKRFGASNGAPIRYFRPDVMAWASAQAGGGDIATTGGE